MSIGVALADNLISNEVEAYINNADNSFKTTTGNISLSATTDATIEAVSVAASLAAGFGVAAGIALSGAGAESKNTILGKTNAYISNSVLDSASGVSLTAANSANIDAKIAATSASAGGGAAGVGVAIGAAIANNFIGYEGDTHNPAQVQAYLQNSSVMATGDLTLSAVANGNINAGVGAGAMAIAAGVGGGSGSGSGVNTVNKVGTLVKAFIDGDRTTGISAANISLTANDTSTITADAASVAVAATFALGGAATVGVSLAKNEIANDVQAFIRNITHSFTTTTGNIQLTATETASITTSSVAASVAGGIVGLSGAGAEALNNINNSTRSYISASKPITAQGNVTLTSWDSSNIQALAGQVSGGTTAAVGESIAINNIGNQIIAEINSSTVTATTGDVTLNASSKNANSQEANIKSFSVSGSLAPGFSGAGAVTVNNIANVIQANIVNDSNVQASGNINLTAQEDAKIESFAGAVSLSIVASDGASSATNNISSQIIAEVNKSTLTTSTGAVNLNAIATGIIDSTAAGGIGAGLFAYGGAITENNLSNTVRANVANDAKINAQGDVNLSAKNTATIQASAGQVATAGGAAFGASVAVNNSANTTQTYISDSNVTSIAGYVGVIAENTGTIKSESAGAAVADGVALTGSVSVNNITNTTESYVKNTTISGFNGVEIAAKDESTIKSLAGQISVGISGAGVGAAAAYNNIGNVVKAYVTADDGKVTNIHTSGNAIVSALDKGTIETIAVGGSGGAVVGAAGSVAVNQMSNNVYAFVHKSNIKAQGSVGILADATHSIITEGGTLSGGLLGIGGTMAVNDFKNTTSAYVNNSAIDGVGKQSITIPQTDGTGTTQSLFGVAVLATSQDNLDVTIGTTSIGGFAFVGSIAVNSFENQTQAYVKDVAINATIGSTIPEQSVYIKAFNDSTVNVNAGTAGVGGNAVGVGIDITTMKNATTAYIDSSDLIFSQGSIVNANKDLIVEAKTQQSLTSDVVAWGGGLGFSVQGAVSIINVSSDMSGDAITAISDTLSIVAEQLKELDNMGKDSNGESNITTNKNISNSRAFSSTDGSTIDLKNHGFTDGEAVVYELVGDGTDTSGLNNQQTYYVKVIDENSFQLSATKDGAAITLSQAGDEQQQFLKPESTLPSLTGTTAFIAGTASARSNLIVNAHETTKLNASVTGASVGAIGAGAAIAIADITHNAKAYVDAISRVNAANTTIQSTGFVDSTKLTAQAGAAGGAALGAAVAYLTSDNNSTAYIGENTTVNRNGQAQVVNVIADSISRLETDAQGASVGAAAVGVVLTKAEETGATSAYLDQGVQVQQTNNLNITANVDQLVKATGLAAGGGIISGNGVDVQVNVNPQINVYIGENNLINVAQDVNVISNVILDGDAAAEGDNYGGLAVGLAFSEVNSQPTINTYVGANTIIEAGNVTVESRAGVPIAIADTNIDPSLAVDNTARTITFSNEHNLQTGNQVIYSNGGGDDIGGISNDRTYNVIAVDSTTVKLGSEFQGTAVDEQANTIRFNQNHNLRNGDKVIYEAANGTAIGGLVSGNPYYVKVLDNKTVQLAETQFVVSFTYSSDNDNNQITQEGHGFNTGDRVVYQTSRQALIGLESNKAYYVIKVDANNFRLASTLSNAQAGTALDIGSNDHQHQLFLAPSQAVNLAGINTAITINNHGFQNGDLVIYQRRTAEFRIVEELPANIPPASNNFNKNTDLISNDTFTSANHGFQTGDQVIYTTSGTALGNLTNNTTYYVIRVDSDRFQLSTTENGAAIDITTAPKNSIHQITAVGLQGLQEGISYYVVNSSQNSFQLAATKDGAALTLDKSGLTGTGSVHLFNKQSLVDLTASNTDQHNLHLDLNNSTATGTNHQLITTASITIPSQGDGKFSAYAEGAVGALVGGNGTQATLNISPTVTTYIASGASITTTGNVTIKSLSVAEVTSSTDSDVLGAVAVGDSRIDANVTNTNKTDIHASAQINAQGNVSITSQSDHTFNISGYGAAGSLITFADAEAHATLTHNTQTSINDSASIIAGNELLVASSSNTNGNVKAKADGVGLYGDADAETTFRVNGTNQTNINSNAALEARKLTVAATVDNLKVHARGEATGGGFIGNIDAHATVDLADTKAVVNLNANSSLIGDFVNLSATYQNVNSNSTTSATCFAFGGDTDSAVTNNIPLAATVWTDSASQIQAYKLDVESDFANLNYKSHAYSERYFLDIGSDSTDNNFEPTPTIDFNSQVTLVAREANPILIVDQAGQIHQQSDNVTATITDTDVIVDDINNSNIGAVNFIIPDRSSEMASNGKFVDRGVYTISDPAYSTVQIDNYSAKNLIINHINVVKSGVVPQINYNVNVDDTNIAPTIPTLQLPLDINPTVVTINNWGTSNLILQGVIDNPHDRTILYSGGNIFSQGATQEIISRDLKMKAVNGSIGTSEQRVAAQLIQGYNPVTADVPASNIYLHVQASHSNYLDLTAKSYDSNPVTVDVKQMTASKGEVNIKIGQTTNQNDTAISALYKFTDTLDNNQSIKTGSNIVIDADTTTTNIDTKNIFFGTSNLLNITTGGWIKANNTASAKVNIQQAVSHQDTVTISGVDMFIVNDALVKATDVNLTAISLSILDNAQVQASNNVNLLVGNNFQINEFATITATNNVIIRGDYNNPSLIGTTFTVDGLISAQSLGIYGGRNKNTFNIKQLAATTTINTGGGDDTVNIGSSHTGYTGLNKIQGSLSIYGDTTANNSILNIDNSQDTSSRSGVLTDTNLTGLGMAHGIYYNGFKFLNIKLGKGTNNFTILNTNATTNIDGSASANNNFRIGPNLDTNGNVLNETVNGNIISGSNILGTKNPTTITTGNGNNSFQINRNQGTLKVQGRGNNNFVVSTPINSSRLLPNGVVDLTQTSGNVTIKKSALQETVVNNGSSINVVNSRLILLPPNSNPIINPGSTGTTNVNPFDLSILGRRSTAYSPVNISPIISLSSLATRSSSSSGTNTSASSGSLLLGLSVR
ncbi:hypothetical protein [Anabaena sp. 4-3]|uniref:beta strand repeat-containing protein n=1 Tax=Anabaena sp. 4-3 TaxID=1811979 RepID=UPI000AE94D3E|nr:hypothetical protein [Anabaena sp. 4-3]